MKYRLPTNSRVRRRTTSQVPGHPTVLLPCRVRSQAQFPIDSVTKKVLLTLFVGYTPGSRIGTVAGILNG